MMASQELTIRNTATQQKQLMRFLPIIFGVFLARFPSGLFVYWVTSNLITFTQNYVIYYVLPHKPAGTEEDESPAEAEKKASPAAKAEEKGVPQGQKPLQNQKKSSRARNRKKKKVGKRK
jgi:YidC/Oxa1 family membrane protein insertase